MDNYKTNQPEVSESAGQCVMQRLSSIAERCRCLVGIAEDKLSPICLSAQVIKGKDTPELATPIPAMPIFFADINDRIQSIKTDLNRLEDLLCRIEL